MAFGGTLKDSSGQIPISQGYVADDGFRAAASSALKFSDGQTNVSTGVVTADALGQAAINGQAYGVLVTNTIGAAATGQFALSVFNPNASGKTLLIASIKTMVNYSNTTTWTSLTSANPAYNTNLSSAIVNLKNGGGASVVGSNATANSATIAFPGSGNVDMSLSNPEVISNGMYYSIPANKGIIALVFVGNSQEYAIAIKWIEY